MRVAIATGGTAGHVVPALAIADALRDRGAIVTFIGTPDRAEAELVPRAGYELDELRVTGLHRTNPLRAIGAIGRAAMAVPAARGILRRRRCDVVVGGGGYVAGPVGLACVTLRLPLVLTEADRHLGLTNRLLRRRARRLCLAFAIPGVEGPRVLVTGRPVPRNVAEARAQDGLRAFSLDPDLPVVLIVGGSLGARSINDAAVEGFGRDPGPRSILHVAGRRDFEMLRARLDGLGAPERYRLVSYTHDFHLALAAADLVVARAGGSVFELAAAGKPSILVPYPHATAHHQDANAGWMAEAGAAIVVADEALGGESLRRAVEELAADPARLEAMGGRARSLARVDAADRVADEVLAAASGARTGRFPTRRRFPLH